MPGGGDVAEWVHGQDGIYLNPGFLLRLAVIRQEGVWTPVTPSKLACEKVLHAEENFESLENCRRRSEGGRCLDRHSPSERKHLNPLSQVTPPKSYISVHAVRHIQAVSTIHFPHVRIVDVSNRVERTASASTMSSL